MPLVTHTVTVMLKELRELFHRPTLVFTLILGPLVIMILFGLGSNGSPSPPRAIVVVPPGQERPRLLQDYQQQFDESLRITEYTDDEAYARAQLRLNTVDAALILPPSPFETIAGGQAATIRVLYNELDPLWRGLVPRFVRGLAGEINRAIFLETATEQRGTLTRAASDIGRVIAFLDQAISAADRSDWETARAQVQGAAETSGQIASVLGFLGPEGQALQAQIDRIRSQLLVTDAQLATVAEAAATPGRGSPSEQLGLVQLRNSLRGLSDTITTFTTVPPEVVIAPLAVEAEYVAQLRPDFITFFAPSVMALLLQHVAVSLGALALVRERLAGTFDLFTVAPISPLRLLIGKYLAYTFFTVAIGMVLLMMLLLGLRVPLFGNPWRLLLTLLLLSVSSVGMGFTLSLLATSERQAVQFSMLALLGVVFFSGFALPLDTLRQPALSVSYMMPVTYGVDLLQDVMLRGLPGSNRALFSLLAMAVGLFVACFGLLTWRTRAQ